MYDNDLINRVLIYPARTQGFKKLCIVSGYAEPSMLSTHLEDLLTEYEVQVQLLHGMFPDKDRGRQKIDPERLGIFWIGLRDFQALSTYIGSNGSTFECRYVVRPPQLHTKLYVWLDENGEPARAFVGSPNYTRKAFDAARQGNIVTSDDNRTECHDYFQEHWQKALPCTSEGIEDILYTLRNSQ